MRESVFRFKSFACRHGHSAMKIGVDAVLIAAWTDVSKASRILDAGCGCGVISLICAQRNQSASITAIDIDKASVEECNLNFLNSPWSERLNVGVRDFADIQEGDYELIVSNPPFFNAGVSNPDSARLVARHDGNLSPLFLLRHGASLLKLGGEVSLIAPSDRYEELESNALQNGFAIRRVCFVRGHASSPIKRVMMQCQKMTDQDTAHDKFTIEKSELILEESPGVPTSRYRELCRDFYLKF